MELARTQTKLAQAESRLAAPAVSRSTAASGKSHASMTYSQLAESLERAESELQRLKLRVEGRPVPYYKVVSEFFSDKLGNFVEPEHTCTCNVCCKDLDALKREAFEAAMAKAEEAASKRTQQLSDVPEESKMLAGSNGADLGSKPAAGSVSQQEHQKLIEEIEGRDLTIQSMNLSLKELDSFFIKFAGKGKNLLSEETLFKSKSMVTLSEQVASLIAEVEKRESQESQLAELQAKLKAALNERKMMGQIRSSMDEVEAEVSDLRAQNRDLQDKLLSVQKRLSVEKSGATQD